MLKLKDFIVYVAATVQERGKTSGLFVKLIAYMGSSFL